MPLIKRTGNGLDPAFQKGQKTYDAMVSARVDRDIGPERGDLMRWSPKPNRPQVDYIATNKPARLSAIFETETGKNFKLPSKARHDYISGSSYDSMMNLFDVNAGIIVAIRFMAEFPEVARHGFWTDVAFDSWTKECRDTATRTGANDAAKMVAGLKYVLQDSIIDTDTKGYIKNFLAKGELGTDNEGQKFLRQSYTSDNAEFYGMLYTSSGTPEKRKERHVLILSFDTFLADLLGSSSGLPPAYLSIRYKKSLGGKIVTRISIYRYPNERTTDKIDRDEYYMLLGFGN